MTTIASRMAALYAELPRVACKATLPGLVEEKTVSFDNDSDPRRPMDLNDWLVMAVFVVPLVIAVLVAFVP